MELVFFVLGLFFGSFYNVCIYRLPLEQSAVYPPSHCTACGKRLNALELIPVLSWLMLRGRCRRCHSPISAQYPIIELLTGFAFLLLYRQYGFTWSLLLGMALTSVSIIIAVTDIQHQIIPDVVLVCGAAIALILNVLGKGVPLIDSLLGALAGGGILLLLGLLSEWLLKKEGMGGGDIKLTAMYGLYLGWKMTLIGMLTAVYIAAVFIVILMLLGKKKIGEMVPFGPFLAMGAIIAFVWGEALLQWYLIWIL